MRSVAEPSALTRCILMAEEDQNGFRGPGAAVSSAVIINPAPPQKKPQTFALFTHDTIISYRAALALASIETL